MHGPGKEEVRAEQLSGGNFLPPDDERGKFSAHVTNSRHTIRDQKWQQRLLAPGWIGHDACQMHMHIPEAGDKELALAIDYPGSRRDSNLARRSDFFDSATRNHHGLIWLGCGARGVNHGDVLDGQALFSSQAARAGANPNRQQHQQNSIQNLHRSTFRGDSHLQWVRLLFQIAWSASEALFRNAVSLRRNRPPIWRCLSQNRLGGKLFGWHTFRVRNTSLLIAVLILAMTTIHARGRVEKAPPAPVYLNHLYVAPSPETYKAVAENDFLQKNFGAFESRTTTRADKTYTGLYFYGQHTYFELLEPPKDGKAPETFSGVAFGTETPGGVQSLAALLDQSNSNMAMVKPINRQAEGKTVNWFLQLIFGSSFEKSKFATWLMEYNS